MGALCGCLFESIPLTEPVAGRTLDSMLTSPHAAAVRRVRVQGACRRGRYGSRRLAVISRRMRGGQRVAGTALVMAILACGQVAAQSVSPAPAAQAVRLQGGQYTELGHQSARPAQ